jgi:hypothetical protein
MPVDIGVIDRRRANCGIPAVELYPRRIAILEFSETEEADFRTG